MATLVKNVVFCLFFLILKYSITGMASTGQPKKVRTGQKEHDSQDNSLLTSSTAYKTPGQDTWDRTPRTGQEPIRYRTPRIWDPGQESWTGYPGQDILDRNPGQVAWARKTGTGQNRTVFIRNTNLVGLMCPLLYWSNADPNIYSYWGGIFNAFK
jgi:hypothetical protein